MPFTVAAENWNLFACSLLIAAWKQLGIRHYFISPGYRNAPFIAALQKQQGLELVSCFDERAAAYQALGASKATGQPSILLCTSGTAGANYLPALIEAEVDQWPLIVVTADRPFELVHAAAQQVIDQRQLFGRFVKKSFDFPAPSPALVHRAWLSYARELASCSLRAPRGPVHINLPFGAPLDPTPSADRPSSEQVASALAACALLQAEPRLDKGGLGLGSVDCESLRMAVQGSERGLLLIGRLEDEAERKHAALLQSQLAWPCFVDIGSGLKGGSSLEILDLDQPAMLQKLVAYAPDCVVHLGRRLVSRHFDDFLAKNPPTHYWVFSSDPGVQDPMHLPQRRQVNLSLAALASSLAGVETRSHAAQERLLVETQQLKGQLAEVPRPEFCFADVAEVLLALGAAAQPLFLANSTAIRAFDHAHFYRGPWPRLEANRGVSGIEGLLATTYGLARGSQTSWTCVIGDIALLHDLNSMVSLRDQPYRVIVVLVNNRGGRIFEGLPLKEHAWVKDPLISTPHDLCFAPLAEMAGVPYSLCENRSELELAYRAALLAGQSTLIECRQSPEADYLYQQATRRLTRS